MDEKSQKLAIASLVLGIVAIALCFTKITFIIPLACGVLAIVFACMVKKETQKLGGMALAGFICGIVSIVLTIVALIISMIIINKVNNHAEDVFDKTNEQQQQIEQEFEKAKEKIEQAQ